MIDEQNMKTKTKTNKKDEQYQQEVEGSSGDILEHQDEDSKERNMLEICQKVQPDDGHQERSNRPLPTLKQSIAAHPSKCYNSYLRSFTSFPAKIIVYAEVKDEDYCQQVDHPVHEVVELEISPLHLKCHYME